ncbi:hypothetical protein [Corynebacterium pelargi]|uniref:hypothetical protein n=1 Tax=Corynebacterium pelargi TaxID=1471400 RepID=UPI001008D785|nr:hypothetical protein [Corynebacterium pelargi]
MHVPDTQQHANTQKTFIFAAINHNHQAPHLTRSARNTLSTQVGDLHPVTPPPTPHTTGVGSSNGDDALTKKKRKK